MEQNRKEITKTQFKLIVFGAIILGIILYSIFVWLIMSSGIEEKIIRLSLFGGLAGIIIGVGIGLGVAYSFKIKDYKY